MGVTTFGDLARLGAEEAYVSECYGGFSVQSVMRHARCGGNDFRGGGGATIGCMTTGLEGLAFPEFSLPPYQYVQSAAEVLDYTVPWGDWLAGREGGPDTIVSSSFVGDAGLTLSRVSFTASSATVWVSGGAAHFLYKVLNTVTTAGGRTATRELWFKIKQP